MAVESIIHSKTFDNGMICASEQHITVLASVYDEVKRLLKEARCYFLNDEEAAKVADVFFNAKTHGVKPDAVGQTACRLAEMAGIEVPYAEKYGDIWEVPVTLPTDTHAAYPMGLCADLGVEKTGGFN